MTRQRCPQCGADLALVGKAHRCAPKSAPTLRLPLAKGKPKPDRDNVDARAAAVERTRLWKTAHRRHYREYMKLYMRDWRCRRAVMRAE
jgi:hypothetical protein